LSIKFIGVEGAFTCFNENNQLKEEKLLFIAGGVGITPFMAMLEVLRKRTVDADVVLLFSARGEEVGLATRFRDAGINTKVFDTDPEGEATDVTRRRIGYEDVAGVPGLTERGVYLCGPDGFMQVVRGYLEEAGVESGKINVESFAF
jgi:ferredoxin-NADP reductase